MPISLDSYKKGLTPEDAEFLSVLEQKPYQAYELKDLMPKATNALDNIANALAISFRLRDLVRRGLIKSKYIRGKVFYISSKAI